MTETAIKRLLVVGLGSIGARHARLARELVPGAAIAALRRESVATADERVDCVVTSLDEALAFAPQAAVIASPSPMHLDSALPLARAGVHLLVEKPIAAASEGVRELIATCRDHRTTLMVGYNLRFVPSLVRFRELLMERRVGTVRAVHCEVGQYLPDWRPGVDYRRSVSARAALGGGVLLELSHELDYLRWLLGEVSTVTALACRQSNLEIDVEDTARLTMTFTPHGTDAPVVASVNMDFIRRDRTRSCTAFGDSGSLRWDALAGSVDVFDEGGAGWKPLLSAPHESDDSYRAEWRNFIECMTGSAEPRCGGDDGAAAVELVEAARLSSETGRTVRLGSRA